MNSVPALIAKASATHNPIIYAITHHKYCTAIARYVPLLRPLLRVQEKDLRSCFRSTLSRRATVTSQSSLGVNARTFGRWGKTCLSSASDSRSCWVESEVDGSSVRSFAASCRTSVEILPLVQLAGVARGAPNPTFNAACSSVREDVPKGWMEKLSCCTD